MQTVGAMQKYVGAMQLVGAMQDVGAMQIVGAMQLVGAIQKYVGAMQFVRAMQIVNTIKVRPMKSVVIIQVIIMKWPFGMSRQKKNLGSGRNMIAAACSTELKITRTG